MAEVTDDRLRLLIERVERLTEEEHGIRDDKKDVFLEMKAAGYDVKIVRQGFLEGVDRYSELYKPNRPSVILQFVERVVMLKGRLVRSGAPDPTADNPNKKASTATAYIALVWFKDRPAEGTLFDWIEPCRDRLERDDDYPDEMSAPAELGGLFEGVLA